MLVYSSIPTSNSPSPHQRTHCRVHTRTVSSASQDGHVHRALSEIDKLWKLLNHSLSLPAYPLFREVPCHQSRSSSRVYICVVLLPLPKEWTKRGATLLLINRVFLYKIKMKNLLIKTFKYFRIPSRFFLFLRLVEREEREEVKMSYTGVPMHR